MDIRRATPKDAEQICTLHSASIQQLCSSEYSPKQIAAWSGALEPRRYLPAMEQLDFFVVEDHRIVGFFILDTDRAELNALYLDPAVVNQGIGRQLLEFAEHLSRQKSMTHLRVKSTLNAVGFYKACGYKRIKDSIHINPMGLELACVEMLKKL